MLTANICLLQVDAIETESHYQLEVALPGIRKGVHVWESAYS